MDKHFAYLEKVIKRDNIEGKVFSFDDPEQNKSTRLKINKVNRILGSGSYSRWVAEVNVELENDTRIEKTTHNMVIKRYEGKKTDATQDLKQSYENYKALKEIEIPTWTTYRIKEEHKLALMTLGIKEGEILLTANDDDQIDIAPLKENPVKKIDNLDEFVLKASQILEKVNIHGYRLSADSYGVIFKPQQNALGVYNIDIIISDLDNLGSSTDPFYVEHYGDDIKERWKKENKDALETALFCIFPGNRGQKERFAKSVTSQI